MVSRTEAVLRRQRMEITLPQLIELFVATKRIEGCTPKTVNWYSYLLTHFANYIGNGEPTKLKDVSVHDARAFIASLQNRLVRYKDHPKHPEKEGGLSPYTIHGYVRALKAFSSWLHEEGFAAYNIFARLKKPKLPKPMIKILSDEEMSAILSAMNRNSFLGARQYTIVLLLLDTGIRASELCGLTLDNTDIDNGTIKVMGKGRKERIVPFASGTKKALLRYVTIWRPEPAYEGIDNLFLSIRGTPLSYNGLRHVITRIGHRAGIPRLHPHLFRHTLSVKYLINGGDVMTLRLILGHATLEVTRTYVHLAEAHVQVQHHRFSPVDRILARGRLRRRRKGGRRSIGQGFIG